MVPRRISWSEELVSTTHICPRLEDKLIDELFYQDDEIDEMRHTAVMIKIGLEEDPPEGPDIPPLPWPTKAKPEVEDLKEEDLLKIFWFRTPSLKHSSSKRVSIRRRLSTSLYAWHGTAQVF